MWWPTLLLAGVVCLVTFYAKGGLNPESSAITITEMALTLGAGAIVAAAALFAPSELISRSSRRVYGAWPVGLLLAFTALTALSVAWSVQPDESFREAGRMLAYSGVFAAAVTMARVAPSRWPAVIGGVTLGALIVCAYALATKVFPGQLDPHDQYARLRAPFGYWNATGLTAALAVIGCMWLGARRAGHALLSALAYPAMGLALVTLLLAYSRGALVALAIGLVLWFCIVPLRLRGAAVFAAGGLCAAGTVAWTFATPALSTESVTLAARSSAGHRLGALLVAMIVVLSAIGVAVGFTTARRAPRRRIRMRAGVALIALVVLAILAGAGALAYSHRGFTGSISHAVNALTNPNAKPPPNTPGRLTAVASVRARYWKEALDVFDAHPLIGAGAGGYQTARLRYRTALLEVKHAHGFVVQTLADLGLVGLALALALLLTWMAAAGRATHMFNRRWSGWRSWLQLRSGGRPGWRRSPEPYPPERIATLSMLCLVVVFGAHSFVDWTWYVPGDACIALVCAGWLAGRGPLGEPAVSAGAWGARSPRQLGYVRTGSRGRRGHRRAARGVDAVAAAELGQRLPAGARAAGDQPSRRRVRRADGRATRPALGAGAVRAGARRRVGGRTSARARVAAPRGQPAAVEPRNVAAPRAVRHRDRTARSAARAAGGDLPQPRVDISRSGRRGQPGIDRNRERLRAGLARDQSAVGPLGSAAGPPAPIDVGPLEARAARRAEQQPARERRPAALAHLHVVEAEVVEQAPQRARAVEAQVVGARIEVRVERAPRQRQREHRRAPVRGRAQQQPPVRAQHATKLRQPARTCRARAR